MDVAAVLLALLTLAAGVVIGRLLGRSRAESGHRVALAGVETAGREALARSEAAGRELIGLAEAATHEARHEVARLTATLESERASHRRRLEEDAVAESRLREA